MGGGSDPLRGLSSMDSERDGEEGDWGDEGDREGEGAAKLMERSVREIDLRGGVAAAEAIG